MTNSLQLPAKLIVDILSRISSVQPLIRFRSVCKFWQSLILSSSFIRLHLSRSSNQKNKPVLRLYNSESFPKHSIISIHCAETFEECFNCHTEGLKHFRIVASCNGLLCLSANISMHVNDPVYLCNPATRELKKLPDCPLHKSAYSGTYFVIGFGFDPLINDYKVVKVVYFQDFNKKGQLKLCSEVLIYRLGTNSWKRIGDIAPSRIRIMWTSGQVIVNGSIHWMANDWGMKYSTKRSIISFNLSKERFQQMMLPDCISQHCTHIGILWGYFSLLVFHRENRIEVWRMKEYGVTESWTKQIVIKRPEATIDWYPWGFSNDGKVLIDKNPRFQDLVWCDPERKSAKNLSLNIKDNFQFVTYVESLVSVIVG